MELRCEAKVSSFQALNSSTSNVKTHGSPWALPVSSVCGSLDSSYLQRPLWPHRGQMPYLGQLCMALCQPLGLVLCWAVTAGVA